MANLSGAIVANSLASGIHDKNARMRMVATGGLVSASPVVSALIVQALVKKEKTDERASKRRRHHRRKRPVGAIAPAPGGGNPPAPQAVPPPPPAGAPAPPAGPPASGGQPATPPAGPAQPAAGGGGNPPTPSAVPPTPAQLPFVVERIGRLRQEERAIEAEELTLLELAARYRDEGFDAQEWSWVHADLEGLKQRREKVAEDTTMTLEAAVTAAGPRQGRTKRGSTPPTP